MRRIAILFLGAVACAAAAAPQASAQVQPAGTGEPLYTNSTQNTQWFEWPATSGADAYRVRFDYYENNALRANPTVNYGTGAGSVWANWSGVANLQHGGQYGICAQGQYSFPDDSLFFPDGPNSCSMGTMLGRRAYTTIDRSKPTAAVTLADGAEVLKDTKVPLRIDFSDDVAGPFPANFICFQVGGGPGNLCDKNTGAIYGYNAPCSVPGGSGKSTSFTCTADYGQVADGTVWACVIAADASIPDNPNGPNQTATAEKANLSASSCDGVTVDRTPPTVAIGVSAASVEVGELVSFQVSASDATSGLSGAGAWTWGDNTAGGSGDDATHTYTHPGTYEVALTVSDAAGNKATAKKTITVASAGGGTTTPPTNGGGGDGTTPPPTNGGGGGPTSPPTNGGGGGTTPPPANGGGGTTTPPDADPEGDDAPTLEIDAPRSVRARAKSIPVELTAGGAGRVQLTLNRGSRVVARAGVKLDADGTADYRLKLPKRIKSGRYTLKATYAGITESRGVTLTGKASAHRASASSVPAVAIGAGPRALPDGTFHGARPDRTFKAR
jgi:PKD repeat protein